MEFKGLELCSDTAKSFMVTVIMPTHRSPNITNECKHRKPLNDICAHKRKNFGHLK